MLLLAAALASTARAQRAFAEEPTIVRIEKLGPMVLFGDTPAAAARDYVSHTANRRIFPRKQKKLEAWARRHGERAPRASASLAALRASRKPIIGIQLNSAGMVLGGKHGGKRVKEVVRGVREAGGQPLLLPPGYKPRHIRRLVRMVDHLVLLGGADVHPKLYKEPITHSKREALNHKRDVFERLVARRAAKLGIPIVGICRGSQMLNVARGGSLHQDIKKDGVSGKTHVSDRGPVPHDVAARPGSRLSKTFRSSTIKDVASVHHQALKSVGKDLEVVGRAPDGVVEAIESKDGKLRGYQFHPEAVPSHRRKVFRDVVAAAKKTRSYKRRQRSRSRKAPRKRRLLRAQGRARTRAQRQARRARYRPVNRRTLRREGRTRKGHRVKKRHRGRARGRARAR